MSEPAPDGAETGPAHRPGLHGAFAWLIATLVAVHACMALTRTTASLWVLKQGHGEWTVGVLLSLFAVAPLFLALWAGRLADRHGLHRPVGLAALLGLVGAAVALLAVSTQSGALWGILLSCLCSGGAVSVAAVAIQREAGQMADGSGDLKRVFSWVALGPALSNAIAPVIAGLLIDHLGFVWAFALAVLLPLLAWALALRVPRHRPAAQARRQARSRTAFDLLREPMLRRLLMLNVVLAAGWDAHSFVVPVVGHARGLSASSIGLVLGSFAVAATAVRLAIVSFARHLDEVKALRSAMLLATLTLAVYAWLPGTLGLICGSALLGLALGSVQPMILAMLHQVTPPERQGQALGLRMLATNGATIAMPLGFGLLASVSVAAAPLWLMAGLLALAQWPARALSRA